MLRIRFKPEKSSCYGVNNEGVCSRYIRGIVREFDLVQRTSKRSPRQGYDSPVKEFTVCYACLTSWVLFQQGNYGNLGKSKGTFGGKHGIWTWRNRRNFCAEFEGYLGKNISVKQKG